MAEPIIKNKICFSKKGLMLGPMPAMENKPTADMARKIKKSRQSNFLKKRERFISKMAVGTFLEYHNS